jgi:hypothetical protein
MDAVTDSVIAARLRAIRRDLHGEHGAQFMADDLGIPLQTWVNFEKGVVIPGRILLEVVVRAHVNPRWLLTGEGTKYDPVMTSALQNAKAR